MSYFLFGLIKQRQGSLLSRSMNGGFVIKTEYPKIVDEMLMANHTDLSGCNCFFVVARPEDDTSDTLISPFTITMEEISNNLRKLEVWLKHVIIPPCNEAELYITEGFDSNFQQLTLKVSQVYESLNSIIQKEGDWPSIVIRIQCDNDSQQHHPA